MPFGGGELCAAKLRLLGDQPSGLMDIARHEDSEAQS